MVAALFDAIVDATMTRSASHNNRNATTHRSPTVSISSFHKFKHSIPMPSVQASRPGVPLNSMVGFSFPALFRVLLILALFCVLSHGNSSTNNTVEGKESNQEDLLLDQTLKEAFETAQRTLNSYQDAKARLVALSDSIIDGKDNKEGIAAKLTAVEQLKEEIAEKSERVDRRVREINAQQILELKEKVERLHHRELERRALLKEREDLIKKREQKRELKRRRKLKQQMLPYKKKAKVPEGAIKKEELEEKMNVQSLLEESDKKLEEMFVKIVDAEVEDLQGELEEVVIDATTALGELEETEQERATTSGTTDEDCSGASLTDAVQMVQQSLVKFAHDKVGMVDHLAKAHVVHHLTSETFVPPSYSYEPLGNRWWFQYLPDDWEKGLDAILPDGWRRWNTVIPDDFYHTFVSLGF
jgi:hypothetical protein